MAFKREHEASFPTWPGAEQQQTAAATAAKGKHGAAARSCLRRGRGGRQRVFAASSLGGAAREQYAAMEAGGGAVATTPKKEQLKDRPAAGRRGRKSVRTFGARFSFSLLFSLIFLLFFPIKRFFFQKKGSARSRSEHKSLGLRAWGCGSGGNEIHTARRLNALLTCRLVVF